MRNKTRAVVEMTEVRMMKASHAGAIAKQIATKPNLAVVLITGALLYAPSIAKADDFAYVVSASAGSFGIVDLNTGAFTQITSTQPYMGSGLAELNGVLYGAGGAGPTTLLYRIDPTTGNATVIGDTGVQTRLGSTTTGLFGIQLGVSNAALYSINATTGAATVIGYTGISQVYSTSGSTTGGMSVGAQNLYFMVSTGDTLASNFYSINTTTGAPTLIATLNAGVCMKDMAFVNGSLYAGSGYCTSGSNIYKIDPNTGVATFVATASGYYDLLGLAPTLGPAYNLCLLYDSTKAVHSGATLPVKLQLCDRSGNDLSSSSITLHATSVTQTSTSITGLVEDSGNANPDNDFRFDSSLGSTGGYIFNLKTTGLSTGTYNLNFTVTGDSFNYAIPFQVK